MVKMYHFTSVCLPACLSSTSLSVYWPVFSLNPFRFSTTPGFLFLFRFFNLFFGSCYSIYFVSTFLLSIFLYPFICLSYLCLNILSLSLSLSMSLCVSVSLSLSLSLSPSLSHTFPVFYFILLLSLFILPVSPFLSRHFSLPFTPSLSTCLSVRLSISSNVTHTACTASPLPLYVPQSLTLLYPRSVPTEKTLIPKASGHFKFY